jgi:hypothetical protein
MLSTSFDDEEGPGMQLNELGRPIDLDDKEALEEDVFDKEPVPSLKVDHMV